MKIFKVIFLLFLFLIFTTYIFKNFNLNWKYKEGQEIDNFNNVAVYYNGGVSKTFGRNMTEDGYNLGYKYQCVEFIKRYYFEYFNHKMPNSYGNAKDFFDKNLEDDQLNKERNLIQFTNPSKIKPEINDILVFNGSIFNFYGHVAIISDVKENEIEIIQQNSGPFGKTREKFSLIKKDEKWFIDNKRILGWLRKN